MSIITKEMQEKIKPSEALQLLKEGNKRFIEGKQIKRDLIKQAETTALGQYPVAVTLSCIDSRTSIEHIFDQGMGDVFSVRIAGNIVNEDILGSMEFGCAAAGSKIIVVIGHTKCGAIKGACDNVKLGNLSGLLNKIKPAIDLEKSITKNRDSSNSEFIEKVSKLNVKNTVTEILNKSLVLKELVETGKIGIVGATHDIQTGQIHFDEETLIIK